MQINLADNQLCGIDQDGEGTYTDVGIKAIAGAMGGGSLTTIGEEGIHFKDNHLGAEGWGAIFAAVCGSAESKVTTIDASGEELGIAGANAVAKTLKDSVNRSLTQVLAS